MTSENDMNVNEEISSKEEEEKPTIEEVSIPTDTKTEETKVISSEESTASKEEEEEPVNTIITEKEKDDINETDAQPLFEQPVVLEGKRSRKPTLRLEVSDLTPVKKELSIPQGHGKPLGEIEYINYQITHASTDDLSRMRNICFGRRGNKATIRKNLREFKGFEFERDSDEYQKHLTNLTKLKKDQLRSISNILGLSLTGRNTDHAQRILNFLCEPVDEGKRIAGRKSAVRNSKKRSTNSKESIDTDHETKKQNGENEHGSDYVYKPGKKRTKDPKSTDTKRKKETPEETTADVVDKSEPEEEKLPEKTEPISDVV